VDFYNNAFEQLESAKILAESGKFRVAVTLLCLSGELFLKSLVERKDPNNQFLNTHDIVGLGNALKDDVDFNVLAPRLKFLRKYLNDSRYPFDAQVYTKAFYEECLESILDIQYEVDSANSKKSDVERLSERFGADSVFSEFQ